MNRLAPTFDDHRAHLAAMRSAALEAANPADAVRHYLQPADFAGAEKVYLVGAGKAGVAMTQAAAELLGDRLAVGVVAVPRVPDHAPERVTFVEGGHPEPTPGSVTAGRAVEALLSLVTGRDLVIALISGGGSALLELPRPGLTLADLQETTLLLLRSGATIQEMNLLRSRLSQLKAGGLARLAHPARVLGLILSDVVGNSLGSVASGPTVFGLPDFDAPLTVVDRYGLRDRLPAAALQAIQHGTGPLGGDTSRVENRLIGSNRLAAEAAAAAARQLGFEAQVVADDWQGEARVVGRRFARLLISPPAAAPADPSATPFALPLKSPPRCFVVGGESTVVVRGAGQGGRNQEVALAAALAIDGMPNLAIGTFATDGVDGPTDAAGAVVTGDTLPHARARGLDPERYLDENDSYHFFQAAGGLVITGPTGTNVNDLMFGLVY